MVMLSNTLKHYNWVLISLQIYGRTFINTSGSGLKIVTVENYAKFP